MTALLPKIVFNKAAVQGNQNSLDFVLVIVTGQAKFLWGGGQNYQTRVVVSEYFRNGGGQKHM